MKFAEETRRRFGPDLIVVTPLLIGAFAALIWIGSWDTGSRDALREERARILESAASERDPTARRALSGDSPPEGAPRGLPGEAPASLGRAELDRIRNAALAIVGPGVVTEVDRSDDLGEAYEVEIVTERGEVDIALNRKLERVPNLRYDD